MTSSARPFARLPDRVHAALHLSLDDQAKLRALRLAERLERLLHGLSLRHEAAGEEQAHNLAVAVNRLADQLGVDAPGHAGRLEAKGAIAMPSHAVTE